MTLFLIKDGIELFNCEKIIYFTYECDFNGLPIEFKNNIRKWSDYHFDWRIEYSNKQKRKEEIIKNLNLSKWAAKCFDHQPGIVQADFWKYTIMHSTGGVYADLDSLPETVDSTNKIVNSLTKKTDLIAMPKGAQTATIEGSNPSNFILSKKSYIGSELCRLVSEYLEIGGYFMKREDLPPNPQPITIFCEVIANNLDKVSQTYDDKYVSHSMAYKPIEYRTGTDIWKYERLWSQHLYHDEVNIKPYTKSWSEWYTISRISL